MKTFFRHHPYWLLVAIVIAVSAAYWSLWATGRYVSEANVVLQSAQPPMPSLNMSSLLKGGSAHELLMLRDHLLSVDMLKKLDGALNLREHYADRDIDLFSRLPRPDVPLEEFHQHYLKRISVELDEYAQVLRIKAEAYDPVTAHQITTMLLAEGEAHMNVMGQRLAATQVRFIEVQVEDLNGRLIEARNVLLAYQNQHGLVSPTGSVESLSAVVATLEGELAKLNAQKHALSASRSAQSPEMVRLSHQIAAVRKQIDSEQARMAAQSGDSLNRLAADFETLRLQAEFALQMYSNALAALESTRVEAARTLKQVSVLQSPTDPEYATEPRRLYNITVLAILALLAGLVTHLLVAIIRDHKD